MGLQDAYSASGRIPQRERGRVRRERIIDAACEILAKDGEDALTLHAAGLRSETSIGSMYHFFADREQLLRAVADRHFETLTRIMAPVRAIPLAQWAAMSAAAVIRLLFQGALDHFVANPDALIVQHLQDPGATSRFEDLLREVIKIRLGEARGEAVAATLYAASTGTLFHLREMKARWHADKVDVVGVLVAYLESVEREGVPSRED